MAPPPTRFFYNSRRVAFCACFLGTTKNPSRRIIAAMIILALMTQTTLLAYFVLAPLVILLIIFRKRIPKRGFLIGVGIFALVQAIYVGGLIADWQTVQVQVNDFNQQSSQSFLHDDALRHAFRLVTG